MAEDNDKDKQQYLYRPDIQYQDTYESDSQRLIQQTIVPKAEEEPEESIEITNNITQTFNALSKVIPLMPAELQTVINGVYKPILDSWVELKKTPYPIIIPEEEEVKWVVPEPDPGEDPDAPKFMYPVPPDLPLPKPSRYPENGIKPNNGGIWDLDLPLQVKIKKTDPKTIIEKEFVKNIADLFDYYVNRLKDIIYHYYSEKIAATFGKKMVEEGNLINKTLEEISFLLDPIKNTDYEITEELRHLFDAGVFMGELSKLKLNFMSNSFPVEQTLFHLKNFKTIYLLRLRYATMETVDGSNKLDAMSNNVLKGLKNSYNQKYDVAFANLYKYMNSSLDILEDTLNTELAGLKAKKTLIEKGGINL